MRSKHSRWPYVLRDLELFADCKDAELARIASLLSDVQVDTGREVLREGSRDRQFMVIAHGRVAVTRGSDRRWLAEVGPGSFVGEMSLLNDAPRTATVTALTPLGLYTCNEREFEALLAAAPSVNAKISSSASRRLQSNTAAA